MFIRPHLDQADLIYDKPNNMNVCNKIKSIFNTILLQLLLELLEGHKKENCTQNQALNMNKENYKIVVIKSPNNLDNYVSTVTPNCCIKLETVTNFYKCLTKQTVLRTIPFRSQSRHEIIQVQNFVGQYCLFV